MRVADTKKVEKVVVVDQFGNEVARIPDHFALDLVTQGTYRMTHTRGQGYLVPTNYVDPTSE